ncbi:keratin, type II cytoskeletal cochleal-like [Numida meleagris]|uniref:keratin, type II cytoskeletal cochleal-like n=1 Tax=Numida meleagris TaxID=8996 RepID=UPI000B3E18CD|nr:keratin, type II cytoskeletal cochleal-like [Numida meleagris]
MSCSYGTNVGRVGNFSSSSLALPRNGHSFRSASCHQHRLGSFSTRSLSSVAFSRPRIVVGECPSTRRGHGFGAAGAGFDCRSAGFGYRVGGASRPCTIVPITVNGKLLQPLQLELDPNVQTVKNQEKEQIKTLNNKFASFIEKVRLLEQQNEALETKWSFLQDQKHCRNTIVPIWETCIGNLKKQLEALGCSRAQLERHLKAAQEALETNKKMYEDERSRRSCTEKELIALKKDVGCSFLSKAELGAKVGRLEGEFDFLRVLYEEESNQLRAHISDTAVVVEMDNSRDPDLDGIVANVKAHYKDTACKSRAEAEAWCKGKFEELRVTAGRNADSLQEKKREAAELTRVVKKLSGEVRNAKEQCHKLEMALADAEQCKETAIKDAKSKLTELEAALQKAKQDLAQQVREFQELMNIKMALDIEIGTYKKLLEGEENRLCAEGGFPVNVSLPFAAVCHSEGGLTYSPEPSFAELANGSSCIRSGNTHMKVVSMTKSTV